MQVPTRVLAAVNTFLRAVDVLASSIKHEPPVPPNATPSVTSDVDATIKLVGWLKGGAQSQKALSFSELDRELNLSLGKAKGLIRSAVAQVNGWELLREGEDSFMLGYKRPHPLNR